MPSQPDAYADGWLFSLRDAVHRCEPGVNRGRRRSGGRRTGELANWRTGGSADRRHRQRYRIRKARTGAHAREAVNRALRAPKTSAKPAPFRPRSRGLQAPLQRAGEPPTSLYQSDAARRAIAARRRKSQAPVNHPPSPSTRLAAVGSSPRCGGGRPRLTLPPSGDAHGPGPAPHAVAPLQVPNGNGGPGDPSAASLAGRSTRSTRPAARGNLATWHGAMYPAPRASRTVRRAWHIAHPCSPRRAPNDARYASAHAARSCRRLVMSRPYVRARPGICGNRSKTRLKSRSTTRSPTRSTTRHRRKPSAAPARRGRYPAITRVAVSRADRPASVRKTSPTHRTGCPSVLQDAFLAAQAASEPAPTHQSVRNLEMRATVQVETSSTPRCRDRTSPFARRPSRQFVRASATARFDRAAALSPAVVGAPALAYPLDKDGSPGLANCESRTVSRGP
ncbi:Uncharacterised protein [Burkholderia pseudomallei]|nr:Uncharacterised protein [Burkholderia pseudomallei]CAK0555523.1 Uncharacterised protein [Burkholderia pseudomallei]VBM88669.1 Uncharacterised protein [Burkholderia pseudomallei]